MSQYEHKNENVVLLGFLFFLSLQLCTLNPRVIKIQHVTFIAAAKHFTDNLTQISDEEPVMAKNLKGADTSPSIKPR